MLYNKLKILIQCWKMFKSNISTNSFEFCFAFPAFLKRTQPLEVSLAPGLLCQLMPFGTQWYIFQMCLQLVGCSQHHPLTWNVSWMEDNLLGFLLSRHKNPSKRKHGAECVPRTFAEQITKKKKPLLRNTLQFSLQFRCESLGFDFCRGSFQFQCCSAHLEQKAFWQAALFKEGEQVKTLQKQQGAKSVSETDQFEFEEFYI